LLNVYELIPTQKENPMPDNPSTNQPTSGTPGTTGAGGSMGTPGHTGTTGTEGHGIEGTPGTGPYGTTGTSGGGTGTGTAPALTQTAQQYGQKITEVATQAKDYVADKVSVVGDKIKDLQNADLGELAENAKEYARRKPGQALLISAAVGMILGLLVRSGRR
jgi:ElaB/YqjD/DUF883 family membrane-anchored ribosome-binding protein